MAIDFRRGPRWYAAGAIAVVILFLLWRGYAGWPSYIVQIDYQWAADLVEGAEVLVDGEVVGKLERLGRRTVNGFEVAKGEHVVDLRLPDCETRPEKVTLGPSRIVVLNRRLRGALFGRAPRVLRVLPMSPTGSAPEEGRDRMRALRVRVGRMVLDMIGVVFAVVVALAADEWRENRELQQRADRAQAAVLAELRANRAELARTRPSIDSVQARLAEGARVLAEGGNPALNLNLEFPDFSDAAWRITQVTDAASRLDFAWLTSIARIYETQRLYGEERSAILQTLGGMGVGRAPPTVDRLRTEMSILRQLHDQLLKSYDSVLGDPER